MRNAITMLGLVSVLALSACGGESGDRFNRFVGTWNATAGTITEVCPATGTYTDSLTDNVVWSTGVSSDLVSTSVLVTCPFMANVRGLTASGVTGQTCTGADGTGTTSTVTVASYTFVISPDGHTATENASGQATYVVQGATIACTFNESGSYQKVGN
jgi:hypothetical protein